MYYCIYVVFVCFIIIDYSLLLFYYVFCPSVCLPAPMTRRTPGTVLYYILYSKQYIVYSIQYIAYSIYYMFQYFAQYFQYVLVFVSIVSHAFIIFGICWIFYYMCQYFVQYVQYVLVFAIIFSICLSFLVFKTLKNCSACYYQHAQANTDRHTQQQQTKQAYVQ